MKLQRSKLNDFLYAGGIILKTNTENGPIFTTDSGKMAFNVKQVKKRFYDNHIEPCCEHMLFRSMDGIVSAQRFRATQSFIDDYGRALAELSHQGQHGGEGFIDDIAVEDSEV